MDILNAPSSELFAKQINATPEYQRASSTKFLAPSKSAEEKAQKSAQDFESFFLYQMLELTMPEPVKGFDGGHGEEMFRHIQNEYVAEEMTKAGGIGLADTIYDQLIKLQENNQ